MLKEKTRAFTGGVEITCLKDRLKVKIENRQFYVF